jgi:hypothetical protein
MAQKLRMVMMGRMVFTQWWRTKQIMLLVRVLNGALYVFGLGTNEQIYYLAKTPDGD